jgi:hypothetical protein
MLYFRNKEDILGYKNFIRPLLFSIIDTHLTLKIDASGKMMVLATDIKTGNPLPDQNIRVMRNISRTHTERWDPNTGIVERQYLPLTAQAFATGISLGKTDGEGFIDTRITSLIGVE